MNPSKISFIFAILFALTVDSQAQSRRDAAYYDRDPMRWDGQKISLLITDIAPMGLTTRDKEFVWYVAYTIEGGIIDIAVPRDKASSFGRRYAVVSEKNARRISGIYTVMNSGLTHLQFED